MKQIPKPKRHNKALSEAIEDVVKDDDITRITFLLPRRLKDEIRMFAIQRQMNLTDVLLNAVREYMSK